MFTLLLAVLLTCNLDSPAAFERPGAQSSWIAGDADGDGEIDVVAAAASALSISYGSTGDSFEPPRVVATGEIAFPLALADADGDGLADIFMSSGTLRAVMLQRNRGGRTFAAPEPILPGTNVIPLIADLDRDGDVDLAALLDRTGMLTTALNDGRGNFRTGPQSIIGTEVGLLRAGDFDGDGHLDIVGLSSPAGARLLRGDGQGAFALPQALGILYHEHSLTAADLNGDGRTDTAVIERQANRIRIDFGSPSGLGAPLTIPVPATPWGTLAADLDSDGDEDLLVISSGGTSGGVALLNEGGGRLRAAAELPGSLGGMRAHIGDTDRDGVPDLIVGSGATIAVAHGHGAGRFRAPEVRLTRGGIVAIADVDGDGADDVLSNGTSSGFLTVTYAGGRVEEVAVPRNTFSVFAADVTDAPGLEIVIGTDDPLVVYERRFLGWSVIRTIPGLGVASQIVLADARHLAVARFGLPGAPILSTHALETPDVPRWGATLGPHGNPSLVARDFTGDGVNDLLVTGGGSRSPVPNEPPLRDGYLSLFRGRGDGTFDDERRILSNESLLPAAAGDFDRDGDPDVVVGIRRGGDVVVLRNDGRGAFGAPEIIEEETDRNLVRYATGDLNGDGTDDLVTSTANIRVTLHLGTRNGFLTRPSVLGRGHAMLVGKTPRPTLFVLGQNSMTAIGVRCKPAPRTLTTTP